MKSQHITIRNNRIRLMPQRAAFLHEERALLIADPHFGKAASFRARGIVIPGGSTTADLDRLAEVIRITQPERLIILGDLMHSVDGLAKQMLRQIKQWRREFAGLPLILISGNHDRRLETLLEAFRLSKIQTIYRQGPWIFSHTPIADKRRYNFAGHLHPAARLQGQGRQQETLPCFHIGRDHAILPAFGSLTGHHLIKPVRGDQVYLIADDEVIEAGRSLV